MLDKSQSSSIATPRWKTNRTTSLLIITLGYVIATLVGLIVYHNAGLNIWMNLLAADVAATLVIWVCSLVLSNASVYDPYWSVQPAVILPLLTLDQTRLSLPAIMVGLIIMVWGTRLTANWITTFKGLHQQDWRYDLIKKQAGPFYQLANLFGIQLMPTAIVFACILPAVHLILTAPSFSAFVLPGLLVSLTGFLLETVADRQMHAFRQQTTDRSIIMRQGLWKHSRHPNYLGEILMWWGVFLVCLAMDPAAWWLGLGTVLNMLLFLFISIPMAEKRLAGYKSDFEEYRKNTRMLLPLSKKAAHKILLF